MDLSVEDPLFKVGSALHPSVPHDPFLCVHHAAGAMELIKIAGGAAA